MTKLTDQQKLEIALDILCGRVTTAAVCYKYGISASSAYNIKSRALQVLKAGIAESVHQSTKRVEQPLKRLSHLEQLVGDQVAEIRVLKKQLRGVAPRSISSPASSLSGAGSRDVALVSHAGV